MCWWFKMELEDDICRIKVRLRELKQTDIRNSPFFSCYECNGFNYNCIEYKEVDLK